MFYPGYLFIHEGLASQKSKCLENELHIMAVPSRNEMLFHFEFCEGL